MIAIAYAPSACWRSRVFVAAAAADAQDAGGVHRAHASELEQKLREAAETIQTQNVSLEQANRLLRERSTAAMESLSATVDARDSYTAGHSRRVQQLSLAIGRELEPLAGRARPARPRGALPRHRQARDPRLDPDEARAPDDGRVAADARHADEGARIIDRLGFLPDAVPAIRHHHERYDGSGYPDGLMGEEIPLGARIIHVADALDSMLTTRASTGGASARAGARGAAPRGGGAVLPALRARARDGHSAVGEPAEARAAV